jgi:hypothetical protein
MDEIKKICLNCSEKCIYSWVESSFRGLRCDVRDEFVDEDFTCVSFNLDYHHQVKDRDAEINQLREEIKKFKRIAREALNALDDPDNPVSLGQSIIESILIGDKE